METDSLLPAQSSSSSSSGATSDASSASKTAVAGKKRSLSGSRRRRNVQPIEQTPPDTNDEEKRKEFEQTEETRQGPSSSTNANELPISAPSRPPRYTSIADRLPTNSFYRDPPNLYIFPGAEIWWDENSTTDSSSSSEDDDDDDEVASTISEQAAAIERSLQSEQTDVDGDEQSTETTNHKSRKRLHLQNDEIIAPSAKPSPAAEEKRRKLSSDESDDSDLHLSTTKLTQPDAQQLPLTPSSSPPQSADLPASHNQNTC